MPYFYFLKFENNKFVFSYAEVTKPEAAATIAHPENPAVENVRRRARNNVYGEVTIDKLIQILNPADLRDNLKSDFKQLLDERCLDHREVQANPKGGDEQKRKYFKLCQEIIVYLDMIKDGFPRDKLINLELFPTLKQLVDECGDGAKFPHYDKRPDYSDLHAIERLFYSNSTVAASMEKRYWHPGNGKNKIVCPTPFKYDEIMKDHGSIYAAAYVTKRGGGNPDVINSYGTFIDPPQNVYTKGTETTFHEDVGDRIIVEESALAMLGYTGCRLEATRVANVNKRAMFHFQYTITNGTGCTRALPCFLTHNDLVAYFTGNENKTQTLKAGSPLEKQEKLAFGKSWGDKFQNIMFTQRSLLSKHFRDPLNKPPSAAGRLPVHGPEMALTTGDNVVAVTNLGWSGQPVIFTGQQSSHAQLYPPGGREHDHWAVTNFTNISLEKAIEAAMERSQKSLADIKKANDAFKDFLETFKNNAIEDEFMLHQQSDMVRFDSDLGPKFLDACILDIESYTTYATEREEQIRNEFEDSIPSSVSAAPAAAVAQQIADLDKKITKLKKENTVQPFFTKSANKSYITCLVNKYYTHISNKGVHESATEPDGKITQDALDALDSPAARFFDEGGPSPQSHDEEMGSAPSKIDESRAAAPATQPPNNKRPREEDDGESDRAAARARRRRDKHVGIKSNLYNFFREEMKMDKNMRLQEFKNISFYDLIKPSARVRAVCDRSVLSAARGGAKRRGSVAGAARIGGGDGDDDDDSDYYSGSDAEDDASTMSLDIQKKLDNEQIVYAPDPNFENWDEDYIVEHERYIVEQELKSDDRLGDLLFPDEIAARNAELSATTDVRATVKKRILLFEDLILAARTTSSKPPPLRGLATAVRETVAELVKATPIILNAVKLGPAGAARHHAATPRITELLKEAEAVRLAVEEALALLVDRVALPPDAPDIVDNALTVRMLLSELLHTTLDDDDTGWFQNYITYNLEDRLIKGLLDWCKRNEVPEELFESVFSYLYITCVYQGHIEIDNMDDYFPNNKTNFDKMLNNFCQIEVDGKRLTDALAAREAEAASMDVGLEDARGAHQAISTWLKDGHLESDVFSQKGSESDVFSQTGSIIGFGGGKKTRKNRKIKIRKFSKDKNKKNKKNKKKTKNKKYKKGKPKKKKPKKTRRKIY